MTYNEDEMEILAEMHSILDREYWLNTRFISHQFVSSSRGRGKMRNIPVSINLVSDTWANWRSFTLAKNVHWDVLGRETYPEMDGLEAEKRLQEESGYYP